MHATEITISGLIIFTVYIDEVYINTMLLHIEAKYRTRSMSCDRIGCVCMHTCTHTPEIAYRHADPAHAYSSVCLCLCLLLIRVHTGLVRYGSPAVAISKLHSFTVVSLVTFLTKFSPYNAVT